ncbi:MAG: ornithine cyclodeaminase family protein [Clostridia bacterium]|nr:ornithine cyclodeaminase family protein [Clostridia bacterium]
MNKTLIVNRELCTQLLSIEECIPAMRDTLISATKGEIKMLQRQMIPHEGGNMLALMPASLLSKNVTGSKVIIFPGPETKKTRTNQGVVPLFDTVTGALLAIVDAELITVVRTAATSAAATDVLARKDASSVAILGAGNQGKAHAEAMTYIRDIKTVYVWDMFPAAVEAAVEHLKAKFPGVEIIACETAEQAVKDADIVCTVTAMKADAPFLKGEWLKEGAHVNAVGACSGNAREIETSVVKRCKIYYDWEEATMRDAGDLAIPMRNGEVTMDDFMGEVGSVMLDKLEGRVNEKEITLFETIGISVEDIAAAYQIYEKAKEQNLGVWLEI